MPIQDEADNYLGEIISNTLTANYIEAELNLSTDHITELNDGYGIYLEENYFKDYTINTGELRLGNTGNENYVSLLSDPLLGVTYNIILPFTVPTNDDLLIWDGVSGRLKWSNDLVINQLEVTNIILPGVSHQGGDIYINTGTTVAHLPIGVSGQMLIVDESELTCMKWKNQSDYIFIKDVKVVGTNGGTFFQDTWIPRFLNDIDTSITGSVTLTTGTNSTHGVTGDIGTENPSSFTLEPGTYLLSSYTPAYNVSSHQTRLYNNTTSQVEIYGSCEHAYKTTSVSTIHHQFQITTASEFYIEHKCENTEVSDGFGRACGNTSEFFTRVIIFKLF